MTRKTNQLCYRQQDNEEVYATMRQLRDESRQLKQRISAASGQQQTVFMNQLKDVEDRLANLQTQ